jgi:ferredoxin
VLRVEIDPKRCIGSSNCMEEAPDVFLVSEAGLATLLPGAHPEEELLRGARACPVDAIRVIDDTGRVRHP